MSRTDFTTLLRPRTEEVQRQAGFFRRALAFILDILLLDLLIAAPFTPLLAGLVSRASAGGALSLTYTSLEYTVVLVLFLVVFAYFLLFEYVLGQTVGMMLLGIRLSGARALWKAAVRNCFLLPLFPFVLFWIIEPIAILFFKRGVLEQLSNTRTIYKQEVLF